MRPTAEESAPAKLNLALSVGPREASGKHPICTWMVTVSLCDDLLVTRLEDDRVSRYAILWHADAPRRTEIDWSVTKDLAVRAHLRLEEEAGRDLPVQMKLEKRIPVSGGLGGGSSNAAAMLRAVNRLFELGLSTDELATIGAELGSDVPFFVRGGSAVVQGLGETIQPHQQTPDLHSVIVMPQSISPTTAVYEQFDVLSAERDGKPRIREADVHKLAATGGDAPHYDDLFNDLAEPAMRLISELAEVQQSLSELAERPAQVAGSGSSLYVLCDDAMHAEALAGAVEEQLDLAAVAVTSRPPVEIEDRRQTEA